VVRDDAGVVTTAVIEDRPTMTAEQPDKPPTGQLTVEPQAAERQPDEPVAAPGISAPPARQRVWSMPTAEAARQRTDEFGRIAIKFGAILGTVVAKFARSVARVCGGIAAFGRQVLRQVPPALQLLGALGLCLILSIAASLALDNVLGKSFAAVFVPGFALAFGVVANRWYSGLDGDRRSRNGVQDAGDSTSDLERSVEYVDAKLAFALTAFGTERHQQAVVALIQAKTATELSFGTAQGSAGHAPRPRIRDGGAPKTPRRGAVSAPGHS